MLNNRDFIELERRLWREGNPLADELASTRDELLYLLSMAKKVLEKYSPMLNDAKKLDEYAHIFDLDYFKQWDNLGDAVDNLTNHLGE
jgi:hypothetical protein